MVYIVEVVKKYKVAGIEDICEALRYKDEYVDDACDMLEKSSSVVESRQVVGIFKDHEKAVKCKKLEESGLCGDTSFEQYYVVIREIDSDF